MIFYVDGYYGLVVDLPHHSVCFSKYQFCKWIEICSLNEHILVLSSPNLLLYVGPARQVYNHSLTRSLALRKELQRSPVTLQKVTVDRLEIKYEIKTIKADLYGSYMYSLLCFVPF